MVTAKQAVTSFGRAYPGGNDSGGAPEWLSILGAVASVGTLVVTGGTSAAVLGGIATAAGALGTFADAGADDIEPTPLDAESPQGVYDNLKQALDDLKTNIKTGEEAISHGCTKATSSIHGTLVKYDLGSPALLSDGNATDYEHVERKVHDDGSTSQVIFVDTDTMRSMANDTIPVIQTGVKAARRVLSGGLGSVPWDRPSGFGANPYSDYAALVGELDQLLYDTDGALDHVASRLVFVARDFDKTDDAVGSAQRDLTRDVQQVAGGSGAKV